jgi:hypothetical protein
MYHHSIYTSTVRYLSNPVHCAYRTFRSEIELAAAPLPAGRTVADHGAGTAGDAGAAVETMLVALVGILAVLAAILVVTDAFAAVLGQGLVDEDGLANTAVLAEHLLAGALVAQQADTAGGPRVLGRAGAQLPSVDGLAETAVLTAHSVTVNIVTQPILALLSREALAAGADAAPVVAVAEAAVPTVDGFALVPLTLATGVHVVRTETLRLAAHRVQAAGAVVMTPESGAACRRLLFATGGQRA